MARQKEKLSFLETLELDRQSNFTNASRANIESKNHEVCDDRDSNPEPKQTTYRAWEAWILPLNHHRGVMISLVGPNDAYIAIRISKTES